MPIDSFPPGVAEQLQWYVYRLIDPRNGETFYVGKGNGGRIFAHARGDSLAGDEDAHDLKAQRIKEIRAAGLEVGHVVHRHGIRESSMAYQIEAALMDAYPGLTNKVGGHGSGFHGPRHVEEIVRLYEAEPFEANEPLLLISVRGTFQDETIGVYEAARYAWKVNPKRARKHTLVLAHNGGLVVEAFRATDWLEANTENFPGREPAPGRWGFVGAHAEPAVRSRYVRKRVPERYRRRGAANPIRYCEPE